MKHIGTYFPTLEPYQLEDMNIEYRANGSSSVLPKEDPSYKEVEPSFFDDAMEFENSNPDLPTLLLLRDSYADWFPNYMPQHFGKMYFHHRSTVEKLEEYVEVYKPDIVVIEVAERAIPGFTNSIVGYTSSK